MRAPAIVALLLSSCSATGNHYAELRTARVGGSTLVTLVPAAGVRINARLKPALEQPGGGVLRFDAPGVSADSAYFTEPPALIVEGLARGRVVASVCPAGERVCRPVVLTLH